MSEKLKSRISINFSAAEYSVVKERADVERVSISSYCRRKILGRKSKTDASRKENGDAANKAFMNDLRQSLITDEKGYFNFQKLADLKRKYKL